MRAFIVKQRIHVKRTQSSELFMYMHKKQIPMQEWICMKCQQTSHVEGDQILHRSWCVSVSTCINGKIGEISLSTHAIGYD